MSDSEPCICNQDICIKYDNYTSQQILELLQLGEVFPLRCENLVEPLKIYDISRRSSKCYFEEEG